MEAVEGLKEGRVYKRSTWGDYSRYLVMGQNKYIYVYESRDISNYNFTTHDILASDWIEYAKEVFVLKRKSFYSTMFGEEFHPYFDLEEENLSEEGLGYSYLEIKESDIQYWASYINIVLNEESDVNKEEIKNIKIFINQS